MKLLIDARFTTFPHHNGISRFGAGLMKAAANLTDVQMLISDDRQLTMPPDLPYVKINSPLSIRELFVARRINRLKPDVVFSPMQVMGRAGRRYGLIVTVHDLIYYEHRTAPDFLPRPARLAWQLFHHSWWPQRLLLNTADAVATVSQTTASLIQEHGLTKRPVGLVMNAPPPTMQSGASGVDRSLVYMGSFMPYKNVATLIGAMNDLPDYTLHLLSPIDPQRLRQLKAVIPSRANVIFHNGVSDATYRKILGRATALVTLSHMEGYGLPLVEAMAAGTPVIASDIPIFREVASPAAYFVSPCTPEDLVCAVRRLEDPRPCRCVRCRKDPGSNVRLVSLCKPTPRPGTPRCRGTETAKQSFTVKDSNL
jgi:glycosyltransferase involved in cell wall biosynthesis